MTPLIILTICVVSALGVQAYLTRNELYPSDDWLTGIFLLLFILGGPVTAIVVLIQRYL